jgi:murein L,D-transpeptidase YafK
MKYFFTIIALLAITTAMTPPSSFFSQQLKFPRVAKAQKNKGNAVEALLKSKGVNTDEFDLFLRAFKKEQKLEVWAKNKGNGSFVMLKDYDFCASTGMLGPKRRSGDKQMPEGFYTINFFNPQSNYHLSFRINYPNESDLVFADKLNPGDNIFIHGDCVTIGCIPIGNDNIEELYLLAAKAKSSGDISVHIFPYRMTKINFGSMKTEYPAHGEFWSWLKSGYDYFENNKTLPNISITDGRYVIN